MTALAPTLERRAGRVLDRLARGLALMGGLILAGVAAMTLVSVIGRALVGYGLGPVPGDFELVQIGCAIAVFSFLPWCQLNRGHVTVDLLVERMPGRAQRILRVVGEVALLILAVLIARQLHLGMAEKFCADPADPVFGWLWPILGNAEPYCWVEATYELNMPVWWGYALGLVGAVLFAITSLWSVWNALNEALAGDSA